MRRPDDSSPTEPSKVASEADVSYPSSPATDLASRPPNSVQTDRVRPINPFVAFNKGETEQSIPARFQQQVRRYQSWLKKYLALEERETE
jgi:hypothetical protein